MSNANNKMTNTSNFTSNANPISLFQEWMAIASSEPKISIPEACCLSTISSDGYPDGRIVLLRHVDDRGFVFYSNSTSSKGKDLAREPKASLTFHWEVLGYQARILGDVHGVSDQESDAYFSSRHRLSQIGAWASQQSQPLESREKLQSEVAHYKEKYERLANVPRPPHWHGYRVVPRKIEFWIDQPYRLHDRFLYTQLAEGEWQHTRLNP